MSSIFLIKPYKIKDSWFFDDQKRDIYERPFAKGVNSILQGVSDDLKTERIKIIFSSSPFNGYQYSFTCMKPEESGYWYKCDQTSNNGWLRSGLFKYFDRAPEKLYVQFKPY